MGKQPKYCFLLFKLVVFTIFFVKTGFSQNKQNIEKSTEPEIYEIKRLLTEDVDISISKAQLLYNDSKKNGNLTLQCKAQLLLGQVFLSKNEYKKSISHLLESKALADSAGNLPCASEAAHELSIAYYYSGKLDEALAHNQDAYSIDSASNNLSGQALNLHFLGTILEKQTYFKKAISKYKESIVLKKQINDSTGVTNSLQNIGVVFQKMGNLDSALLYLRKAYELASKLNYTISTIETQRLIGETYEKIGKLDIAFDIYLKLIDECENLNNEYCSALLLNNIGNVYKQKKLYSQALDNYRKAAILFEKTGEKVGLALTNDNLGNIYESQNNFTKALQYYNKALNARILSSNYSGIAVSNNNLGNVFMKKGEHDKALDYFEEAVAICSRTNEHIAHANSLKNLGSCLLELKNYKKSEKTLRDAYELASNSMAIELQSKIAGLLSGNLLLQSRFEESLEFYKASESLKDSIDNIEQKRAMVEMRARFETAQKENENELLKKANELNDQTIKKQQTLVIAISIITLLIGFLAYSSIRSRKKEEKINTILRNQRKEVLRQAQELQNKNKQLIEFSNFKKKMTAMLVHDLKNPLNMIINIPSQGNNDEAIKLIKRTGKQMLNIVLNILDVEKSEEAKIELSKKAHQYDKTIQNAINQIKYLADEKEINIVFQNTIDSPLIYDAEIMERVLINLLTNAIKYSPVNSQITIALKAKANYLQTAITDQGIGIPEEKQDQIFEKYNQLNAKKSGEIRSTGIGLTFCKLAVEAHEGEIGVSSKLDRGAKFWFTLPCNRTVQINKKETIAEQEPNIPVLSTQSKDAIGEVFGELRECLIFEVSKIRSILNKIDEGGNIEISNWKKEMQKALYTVNEELYAKLTQ